MFKKLLLVLMVLVLSVAVFAENGLDDQGNPNDPVTNDRANACYDGGSMEDKCDSDWEWVCGWYMVRYDEGLYSRADIPAMCRVLLPVEITGTEEPTIVDMTCYIEVAPGTFEYASPAVLGGADGGNFYWNAPGDLQNSYSGWQIWDTGTWSVGYYGDCSPLGIGGPVPSGLNIIP